MLRIEVIAQTSGRADCLERGRLKLAEGDQVLRVTRLWSDDGQPARYEYFVLALSRLPGLASDSEVREDIITLAQTHGAMLGRTTEVFDMVDVPTEVADTLGIDADEQVHKFERVVRCTRGLPIEWRVAFVLLC